jgi:broad specificity phosphatase PhoE
MYFVRHNRLVAPYEDYAKLSLEQLDDLATERISPDIQAIDDNIARSKFQSIINKAEVVWCSPSIRAQQTCQSTLKSCEVDKPCQVDEVLKEIYFSPKVLVKNNPQVNLLQSVRDQLYTAILEGQEGVEDYDELKARIQMIEEKYSDKKAVCFTHGFLMRLLVSYYRNGYNFDLALKNITEISVIDYLAIVELPQE